MWRGREEGYLRSVWGEEARGKGADDDRVVAVKAPTIMDQVNMYVHTHAYVLLCTSSRAQRVLLVFISCAQKGSVSSPESRKVLSGASPLVR